MNLDVLVIDFALLMLRWVLSMAKVKEIFCLLYSQSIHRLGGGARAMISALKKQNKHYGNMAKLAALSNIDWH